MRVRNEAPLGDRRQTLPAGMSDYLSLTQDQGLLHPGGRGAVLNEPVQLLVGLMYPNTYGARGTQSELTSARQRRKSIHTFGHA
jgi:hypothetical protein